MEAVIAIIGILAFAVLVTVIVMTVMKAKKAKKKNKSDNVYTSNGVRYTTTSAEFKESGGVAITHREGDIILERGKVYKAAAGTDLLPGKYTMLVTGENVNRFNVRIDGFVREYTHATDIVLADGDEICAVSHSIILR